MEVYAKRSLNGLIQLWATILLPPIVILIYLIYMRFDFMHIERAYIIIGIILLMTSILYTSLFGKTLFLPDIVIEGNQHELYIHKRKNQTITINKSDILEIFAVEHARMSLIRFNRRKRSYGKLMIKTKNKKINLFPIENVEQVKQFIQK